MKQTLKHIALQNLDADLACEVILVDNASTDNTQEKAQTIWSETSCDKIKLTIVYEPKPGLAYARQTGVTNASYGYLVFCDDDNWLDKNYIINVYNLFNQHTEIAVLGGMGIAELENESLKPAWFDYFYQGYAIGPQAEKEGTISGVYGAGMAVRKSVLKEVTKQPMFLHDRKQNQLTSGGDAEICLRIRLAGYHVLYSPQLTFKHFLTTERLSWSYLKKLHVGLARCNVIVSLYDKALNSENSKLSSLYWFKKALYFLGIYLKYWPKQYLVYRNRIGTVEEIHHISWKNIAITYFKYNFQTVPIYRKIIALKK